MDERPYLVVSTDSHVGPVLDQLRDYCPAGLLDDFDRYRDASIAGPTGHRGGFVEDDVNDRAREYAEDIGVNDPTERLRNMDEDGVVSEVIFHGSGSHEDQRGFIPFLPYVRLAPGTAGWDRDLQVEGRRIYNRWLADFCTAAPNRLLGVAEIPWWDLELIFDEVESAARAGFRCINFPAPRVDMPPYDVEVWEPLWRLCEEYGLVLNTHSGSAIHDFSQSGAATHALVWTEIHFMGHLPLPMMSFGGVFERHPTVKVAFNEQRGYWVKDTLRDLDAIYYSPWNTHLRGIVPKPPSEYWRSNCLLGGSFLARFELEDRHEVGIETISWGRDYPHTEGTWPFSLACLRHAFAGIPHDEVRMMLGTAPARFYGLDEDELQPLADRIGPKPEEVDQPLLRPPEESMSFAFRDVEDFRGPARFAAV
jgi:predicted TIM-barrel fold metal-dependent hydrolase